MTTFVAWIGADSRGVASLNFASDSRISWPNGLHWDAAQKTFACQNSPDIFGYVNDVMFPSMALSQITSAIDNKSLGTFTSFDDKFRVIVKCIMQSFNKYPVELRESFTIFHGGREGDGMGSIFRLNTLSWDKKSGRWSEERVPIPHVSSAIAVVGSGASVTKKWSERWDATGEGNTSRSVFSALCNAIFSREDKYTSPPPQLVSLYRIRNGLASGFTDSSAAFIFGMELADCNESLSDTAIEWRNHYFERCGKDGELLEGAQTHKVPKGLR